MSPSLEKESSFLIMLTDSRGKSLESMAEDCRISKEGYEYLKRVCEGNRMGLKGVERIKEFRESVAVIILKEAYNRKRNKAKKN
tara:strand:- start:8217 stop:8468 length:252 start_codon:yes stop_codon:yes gene_type:complete